MIYTIVPIDVVLNNNNNLDCNYCEKYIDGQLVQLNKNNNGQYSVSRIISTKPSTFLQEKYQPGKKYLFKDTN